MRTARTILCRPRLHWEWGFPLASKYEQLGIFVSTELILLRSLVITKATTPRHPHAPGGLSSISPQCFVLSCFGPNAGVLELLVNWREPTK
jgi:hypothetical protein